MTHATDLYQTDLPPQALLDAALTNKEGILAANGALCVKTGARTGRSPNDRFIVDDEITESTVDWGKINQPISGEIFDQLWEKATAYLSSRSPYVSHLQVGANTTYCLPVKVITELAWHNLFAHHLFITRSSDIATDDEWTLLNAATLKCDPAIDQTNSEAAVIINFTQRKVLICGTEFAGEMKKAMFSVLNFLLPALDVLPMHCAANVGESGDVTLFFGLSGTGKTTLSSDPARYLIGDDEHGWDDKNIFNFEGGCYAKCINLSAENEPIIWQAIRKPAIMENVVLSKTKQPDYHNTSITQNTRAAYPRDHIPMRVEENQAALPQSVIFLCCDLFGVLPPVACLNEMQAAYYFLSGYTALLGSTEMGSTDGIKSTFSTGFGAAFLPRPPKVYADLLVEKLRQTKAHVYLVNTGWHQGGYHTGGTRFDIPFTRRIIEAITRNELLDCPKTILAGFNLEIPTHIANLDDNKLNPTHCWADQTALKKETNILIGKFHQNFTRFEVPQAMLDAGPMEL